MIVVRLCGGIGNQMFQYAAGRALSLRLGVELELDISWFDEVSGSASRQYGLDVFSIPAVCIEPRDMTHFAPGRNGSFLQRIRSRFGISGTRIEEPCFHYWAGFERLEDNVLLVGYWQSERYFKHIRNLLLEDFAIKDPLAGKDLEFAKEIKATDSVSLHIRRGDYVTNAQTNSVHGTCSPAYYTQAIKQIVARVAAPHFFVFSDDPEWARQNIKDPHPMTYVTHNDASKNYGDLRLMSLCKHNIIANSTFSWWGAWLNRNPDKVVVAPERWFADEEKNRQTVDLIPGGWIRL